MISVAGTRIYMKEGDNCSFKVLYRDREGILKSFPSSDIVTLTVKDRDNKNLLFSKEAEYIKIGEETVSAFIFRSRDYNNLPVGDHIYDLVLDTEYGSRHTLIDKAFIHVLKDENIRYEGEFAPHRLVSYENTPIVCISETSLICNFNYSSVEQIEDPGTLILYDKSVPTSDIPDIDDGESEEDTLILF